MQAQCGLVLVDLMQEKQLRLACALMDEKLSATWLEFTRCSGVAQQPVAEDVNYVRLAGKVRGVNNHETSDQKLNTTSRSSVMSQIAKWGPSRPVPLSLTPP